MLLVNKINIYIEKKRFNVTCYNCNLTISFVLEKTTVIAFHQTSFVMIPVYVTWPWYADQGLQVLKVINKALDKKE